MIVALIIILAALGNLAPLLIGYQKTPPGYIFLGTVHHPADYFYYLSQFAQGAHRWATTTNLYTTEPIGSTFIGWSNLLMGNILYLVGISPTIAYHLSVLILTVLLLGTAYKLSVSILGTLPAIPTVSRWQAGRYSSSTLALYLFALFHAFPILRNGVPSYGDYWNNFAVPSVRLGSVPHQLLLAISSMLILYFFSKWTSPSTSHPKYHILGLLSFSFILASLQPVLWALILCSFLCTAILYMLLYKYKIEKMNTFIISMFSIAIGGVLPALYLNATFLVAPFRELRLWEATQQTPLAWYHFFSATGPIFVIACLSIPSFLSHRSFSRLFIFLFALCSFLLFLSPLPTIMGFSHVRFMSTLTILCVSILAADGLNKCMNLRLTEAVKRTISKTTARLPVIMNIYSICKRAFSEARRNFYDQKNRRRASLGKFVLKPIRITPNIYFTIILAALTLYLLPNHLHSIRIASNFTATNAYQYLTIGDYRLLQTAASLSTPQDTFLIIWPYNVVFPGITGRKTFTGHPLLTIDSKHKDEIAGRFFDNTLAPGETQKLLTTHHITHVITYSWAALPSNLYDILATDGSLSLYRVNQPYLKSYSK